MILGDVVSKLETFVWILNHISSSVHPKSIHVLGQMTNLNIRLVVSNYRLVKI